MQKRSLLLFGLPDDLLAFQTLSFRASFDQIFVFQSDITRQRQLNEIFGASERLTFVTEPINYDRFITDFFCTGDNVFFDLCESQSTTVSVHAEAIRERLRALDIVPVQHSSSLCDPDTKPPFIVVTAANLAFTRWLAELMRSTFDFQYPIEVYDLGGLALGREYAPGTALKSDGTYCVADGKWPSKALHKPAIIRDSLARHKTFAVYLDADTVIQNPIDEIVGDYDIGITIRRDTEVKMSIGSAAFEFMGWINAGVLFFNHTPAAFAFLDEWRSLSERYKNDQKALNILINPGYERIESGTTLSRNGCRIRTFPASMYNYDYQRNDLLDESQKIVHFKGKWENLINFQRHRTKRMERQIVRERRLIASLEERLVNVEAQLARLTEAPPAGNL